VLAGRAETALAPAAGVAKLLDPEIAAFYDKNGLKP